MKLKTIQNLIKLIYINISIILISINISNAQNNIATQNFKETADSITNNVLTSAGTLLMTAAFMLFFYGVVTFIYGRVTGSGDLKDIEKGKEFMLWGLIALFVMVSVWGIIKLAQDMLGVKGNEIKIQAVQFGTMNTGSNDTNSNSSSGVGTSNAPLFDNTKTQAADGTFKNNPFKDTTNYPIIKVGASSSTIAGASYSGKAFDLLAGLLKQKKCMSNDAFGDTYDSSDAELVKGFQSVNGLTVDGTVGWKTWEALSVAVGQKTTFTGITVKPCQ